ncbi:hypothetical protein B0H10DRAFT_1948822 [Mycena sp. CBHHK59/15]|nr:hypothetical protein B0H10DRAFT_1948822 [Mycena sp. CBHHK59/15]
MSSTSRFVKKIRKIVVPKAEIKWYSKIIQQCENSYTMFPPVQRLRSVRRVPKGELKTCSESKDVEFHVLIRMFMSINMLAPQLHACLILMFDLLHHPTLDQPFFAKMHIRVEPENLSDFFDIYLGHQDVDPSDMREYCAYRQKSCFRPAPTDDPIGASGVVEITTNSLEGQILSEVHIPAVNFEMV